MQKISTVANKPGLSAHQLAEMLQKASGTNFAEVRCDPYSDALWLCYALYQNRIGSV
jgi:hypothetical protein